MVCFSVDCTHGDWTLTISPDLSPEMFELPFIMTLEHSFICINEE